MAKVELLPSGSYRVRRQVDGIKLSLVFDHRPTSREVEMAISDRLKVTDLVDRDAFVNCCRNYIELKRPVLSPSTVKGYQAQINAMSDHLKRMDINDVDQIAVQQEISEHSRTHSGKSTANFHGFVSAVLGMYRPSLHLSTTLPQKVKFDAYTPSEDDIKRILEAAKGTRWSVPFQLGILGLRRSEVCALDLTDIKDGTLSISKAKVQNDDKRWLVKPLTKTTEGKRTIYLPESLIKEIRKDGLYQGDPGMILKHLHKFQNDLGIPRFRFHDLRAFYASYAHSKGIPDAIIMANGGWQSDAVMKKIYRRAMDEDKRKSLDSFDVFF
jgi:integrase